jgi:hypothetical protein
MSRGARAENPGGVYRGVCRGVCKGNGKARRKKKTPPRRGSPISAPKSPDSGFVLARPDPRAVLHGVEPVDRCSGRGARSSALRPLPGRRASPRSSTRSRCLTTPCYVALMPSRSVRLKDRSVPPGRAATLPCRRRRWPASPAAADLTGKSAVAFVTPGPGWGLGAASPPGLPVPRAFRSQRRFPSPRPSGLPGSGWPDRVAADRASHSTRLRPASQ